MTNFSFFLVIALSLRKCCEVVDVGPVKDRSDSLLRIDFRFNDVCSFFFFCGGFCHTLK